MAARLSVGLLMSALVLAAGSASAQAHEAPTRPASKAAARHEASNTHGPAEGASLGLVAPPAPAVAPAGHGRTKAAAPPDGASSHDEGAPAAASGRRKVDMLKTTSSPADVAASINQRLAELAELRRTAPVAPSRRPAPKRETTVPDVAATVVPALTVVEAPRPEPIKLRWRVPVSWPDELSAPAHGTGLTSSAGVP